MGIMGGYRKGRLQCEDGVDRVGFVLLQRSVLKERI